MKYELRGSTIWDIEKGKPLDAVPRSPAKARALAAWLNSRVNISAGASPGARSSVADPGPVELDAPQAELARRIAAALSSGVRDSAPVEEFVWQSRPGTRATAPVGLLARDDRWPGEEHLERRRKTRRAHAEAQGPRIRELESKRDHERESLEQELNRREAEARRERDDEMHARKVPVGGGESRAKDPGDESDYGTISSFGSWRSQFWKLGEVVRRETKTPKLEREEQRQASTMARHVLRNIIYRNPRQAGFNSVLSLDTVTRHSADRFYFGVVTNEDGRLQWGLQVRRRGKNRNELLASGAFSARFCEIVLQVDAKLNEFSPDVISPLTRLIADYNGIFSLNEAESDSALYRLNRVVALVAPDEARDPGLSRDESEASAARRATGRERSDR